MAKNIYDIAEESKVSIATVSRVINNSPLVNEDTRKKVSEILRKHDYYPKIIKNKIPNISILINKEKLLFDIYVAEILNGVSESVSSLNLNETVIICENDWSGYKVLKLVRERYSDGLIIILSNEETRYLKILEEHDIPFILINNSSNKDYNFIDVNGYDSCWKIMQYLFDNKHRDIAFIAAHQRLPDHRERFWAYKDFLKKHGLAFNKDLVIMIDELENNMNLNSYEHGYYGGKKLFKNNKAFSAVVCSNDEIASGIYKVIWEQGMRIPDDISVVGFDNYPFSSYMAPPLTTMNQSLIQIGEQSVIKLLSLINNNKPHEKINMFLEPNLIIRDSCKKIK